MAMQRIYVTIDTEMDNDTHWGKHYPPTFTSIVQGVPEMLRPIWNKYMVHPIYFVSPEVLDNEMAVKVLKEEVSLGAIIGAHLHPEYIEPEKIWGKEIEQHNAKFPCSEYSFEVEKEKIANLTKLIYEKFGIKPVWYRAARFGADIDTISILRELGYKYDSSVTPNIDWSAKGGPQHQLAPHESYRISEKNFYKEAETEEEWSGIKEYPVTIMGKRWGMLGRILPNNWLFYRWLRPTHMTYIELKNIVLDMQKNNYADGVMMFHSMEIMINKTPYVRNKVMQRYYLWRLDKILEFAMKQGIKL